MPPPKLPLTPACPNRMPISVNLGDIYTATGYEVDFIPSFDALADDDLQWRDGTESTIFSPIVWDGGHRVGKNATAIGFLALDSDDLKTTVPQMRRVLKGTEYLIYTTKRHEPKHHRFRVFLRTSRYMDVKEWSIIQQWFAKHYRTDDACKDAARIFMAGCSTSKIHRGKGQALDLDAVLSMAKAEGIVYHHTRKTVGTVPHNITAQGGTVDRNLLRWLRKRWKAVYANDPRHRRPKLWGLYHYAFRLRPHLPTVKATLLKCDFVNQWLSDHPDEAKRWDEYLEDAFIQHLDDAYGGRHGLTQPLMPTRRIPDSKLPPMPSGYRKTLLRFRKSKGGYKGTPAQDITHRLVLHAITQGKAIVNVPCGLEKSISSLVYAATCATKKKPVWIVRETRKACRTGQEDLAGIGVDSEILVGFDEQECSSFRKSKAYTNDDWLLLYDRKNSPCKTCKHNAVCAFGRSRQHRQVVLASSILFLSHEMLMLLWARKEVPDSALLIVDEQLRRWETLDLDVSQLFAVGDLVWSRQHAFRIAKKKVTGTGVFVDDHYYEPDRAAKKIAKVMANDTLSSEEVELALSYITFFQGECTRYGFRSERIDAGKKVVTTSWIRDRILPPISNPTIMLDASARYTQVKWQGFSILSAQSHDFDYSGLTINVQRGNSTKAHLRKPLRLEGFGDLAVKTVKDAKSHDIFLVANKDNTKTPEVQKLAKRLKRYGTIHNGERGSDTRGSNDFLDCDAAIIFASLFTTLSDYVLRASVTEGHPIEADDIWRPYGKDLWPNMDKDGFVADKLHRAFVRQVIDELYQALMRIGIRRYDGNTYDVVVVLPSPDCLAELREILPGVKMTSDDRGLQGYLYLLDQDLDALQQMSDNQLRKHLGGRSVENEKRSRSLARVIQSKQKQEPAIFLKIRRLRRHLDDEG